MLDLNNAQEQREGGLIAEGTIAVVHMSVRPGNAGTGGWLKRSKNGDSMAINAEFTVVEGPFAKRKFWKLYTVEGTTDGHQRAADISSSQLRGILESARGIRPDDESEQAKNARRVEAWGDFDGLRFVAKIGIEKGKDGYKDKNTLDFAVTPDRKQWVKVEQIARQSTMQSLGTVAAGVVQNVAAAKAPADVGKPAWASKINNDAIPF